MPVDGRGRAPCAPPPWLRYWTCGLLMDITRWHGSGHDDNASQWKWGHSNPAPSLKLACVMMPGTPIPVQNFITILSGFLLIAPEFARAYKVTRLVNFWGSFLFSTAKPSEPNFTRSDVSFESPEKHNYTFSAPSNPKTGNLWANFDGI